MPASPFRLAAQPAPVTDGASVIGREFQDGNSRNRTFNTPFIVSYISHFMPLLPGGVGPGQKPPLYLKSGCVIELRIDGLRSRRQTARAHPGA